MHAARNRGTRMAQSITQHDPNLHLHSNGMAAKFSHFAQKTAYWTGHPIAFLLAVSVIVVWIVSGPLFNLVTPGSW